MSILNPPLLACLQFSDNYYRAELIEALTNSLTPAISISNEVRTVDNLNADVRLILEEITRFLNMEKLLPSFRNTITVRLAAGCWSLCSTGDLLKHVFVLVDYLSHLLNLYKLLVRHSKVISVHVGIGSVLRLYLNICFNLIRHWRL